MSRYLNSLRSAAAVLAMSVLGATAVAAQQPPVTPPVTPPTTPAVPTTRPSPGQAEAALQRPEVADQVRQRIQSSGMTDDQIRSRLRASGYSESLLDSYLGSRAANSGAQPPSASASMSTDEADALKALGLSDEETPDKPANTRIRAPKSAVFGLDIFRRATSQFDANSAGAVDANYRVGAGDQLVVILTGNVESIRTVEVSREGFIVLPAAGQLYVANLTVGDLRELLVQRLGRVYSGLGDGANASTHLSVSVSRLRSNQVFVIGDVENPGSYRVSSLGTALTALYAAGGPTENGSMRRIEIRRNNKVLSTFDVYDYVLRGDASKDSRLENGDVVFVPPAGKRVEVVGAARAAIYELNPNEHLSDLLAYSGGFGPMAARDRVQIERILPAAERRVSGRDRVVIDVPLQAEENGATTVLQPLDLVRVFPIADRLRDRITVLGQVWNPGPEAYSKGMKLSDAIAKAGGVKPDVYLGQVLVYRLQSDSTRAILRSAFRDTTGVLVNDVDLHEDDEVRIFSVSDFRPSRYVTITGAVKYPGRFPYREGLTLRDVVMLAGGFREGALLTQVEVARLPENREGGVTANTIRVPLDSTYVLDLQPNVQHTAPPGIQFAGGVQPPFQLRPYDNILVLRQEDWSLDRTVTISGEVRFPGRYTLRKKDERVSDLIERAGGLTVQAFPEGVGMYRGLTGTKLRVGIDLPRVLKDKDFRDNLTLAEGDSLFIPVFTSVIRISGAVNAPGLTPYRPGASLDDYVRGAGGYSSKADKPRTYVVQPNGVVQSIQEHRFAPDSKPTPQAGAAIVVPAKTQEDKNWVESIGPIAQTLASLAAVLAIALRK